jgi:hypothetical protein
MHEVQTHVQNSEKMEGKFQNGGPEHKIQLIESSKSSLDNFAIPKSHSKI